MKTSVILLGLAVTILGCGSRVTSVPGPSLLSVQRLDALPSLPGASLVTFSPAGAGSASSLLGYQAGIPLDEETTLVLTLGLDPKGTSIDQVTLSPAKLPDGVDATVLDSDVSADGLSLAGGTGTAHVSVQAPATLTTDATLRRWIKVRATGVPRVLALDFTVSAMAAGKAVAFPLKVVLGALAFDDGPVVTFPSGSKLTVTRGGESPAPGLSASLDAWPNDLAGALAAEEQALAAGLQLRLSGASRDDALASAILDDVTPLLARRIGEADGLRIGRALGTDVAPDPPYVMSLLATAAAAGEQMAVQMVTRDRLSVSSGAITWSPPDPLPTVSPPSAINGLALPAAALPALIVRDGDGNPVTANGSGGYDVTPPFTISYAGPAAGRFPSLLISGPAAMWSWAMTPAMGEWAGSIGWLPSGTYRAAVAEEGLDQSGIGSSITIHIGASTAGPSTVEDFADLIAGDSFQSRAGAPAYARSELAVDLGGEHATLEAADLFVLRGAGANGGPTAMLRSAKWDPSTGKTVLTLAVTAGTSGAPFDVVVLDVDGELQYIIPDSGSDAPTLDHAATKILDLQRQRVSLSPGASTVVTLSVAGRVGAGKFSTLLGLAVPAGGLQPASDPAGGADSDTADVVLKAGSTLFSAGSSVYKAYGAAKAVSEFLKEDGVSLRLAYFEKQEQPTPDSDPATTYAKTVELFVGDIFHYDFTLSFKESKQRVWRKFQEFITWGMPDVDGSSDWSVQRYKLEGRVSLDGKSIMHQTAYSTPGSTFMEWESAAISGQWDPMFDYACLSAKTEPHSLELAWKLSLQSGTHSVNGWHYLYSGYDTKKVVVPFEVGSVLKDDTQKPFGSPSVKHTENDPFEMDVGITAPPGTRQYRIVSPSYVDLKRQEPDFDARLDTRYDDGASGILPIVNGRLPEPTIALGQNDFRHYRWIVKHSGDAHTDDVGGLSAIYPGCNIPGDGHKVTVDEGCATRCGTGANGTPARAWRVELPSPSPSPSFT